MYMRQSIPIKDKATNADINSLIEFLEDQLETESYQHTEIGKLQKFVGKLKEELN